ncbi:hypothetical protein KEM48_003251 [Puccinia striiformis f. sp. tritici PST-130]|nr:hypothetical protein KEM48_003251 [Puccinia striiformis f. sp. tritici PST-130]
MDNTTAQAVAVNTTDTQSGKWNGELPGGSTPNLATLSGVANSTLGGTTNSSSLLPSVVPSKQLTQLYLRCPKSLSASPHPYRARALLLSRSIQALWERFRSMLLSGNSRAFLLVWHARYWRSGLPFSQQAKTRRPIRGLRVVSGFDFNGGDEDDYGSFNVWDPKPPLGSAAADKSESPASSTMDHSPL